MATLTYDATEPQEGEFSAEEQDSLKVGEALAEEQSKKLAGKFEDAEALEKAYIELQSKLGEPKEEKAPVKEEKTEAKEEVKEPTPEEKIAELEDKVARTFAEMENQRRRFEKEKEDAFEYGGYSFAKEALNLIDNLDRSKHVLESDDKLKES